MNHDFMGYSHVRRRGFAAIKKDKDKTIICIEYLYGSVKL